RSSPSVRSTKRPVVTNNATSGEMTPPAAERTLPIMATTVTRSLPTDSTTFVTLPTAFETAVLSGEDANIFTSLRTRNVVHTGSHRSHDVHLATVWHPNQARCEAHLSSVL